MVFYAMGWYDILRYGILYGTRYALASTHLLMPRHEPVRLLETYAVHRREVVAAGESAERHQVVFVHTTHVQLVVPAPQQHTHPHNQKHAQKKNGDARGQVCKNKKAICRAKYQSALAELKARVFRRTEERPLALGTPAEVAGARAANKSRKKKNGALNDGGASTNREWMQRRYR